MSVGLYFLFCGLIGYWASRRGRSAILWAILALIISPLLSGIVLALMSDQSIKASITDLQMGQQQMHDRMATNEKMTEQHFQQLQQQMLHKMGQNTYLQQPESSALLSESDRSRFCANCGTKLAPNEKFCPKCGTKSEG